MPVKSFYLTHFVDSTLCYLGVSALFIFEGEMGKKRGKDRSSRGEDDDIELAGKHHLHLLIKGHNLYCKFLFCSPLLCHLLS